MTKPMILKSDKNKITFGFEKEDWIKQLNKECLKNKEFIFYDHENDCVGKDLIKFIKDFLKKDRKDLIKKVEGMRLLFSEDSNMWCRKGSGALYTTCEETATQENTALDTILNLIKKLK